MNWTLLQNSLVTSTLATVLSVAFGLVSALWAASLQPRWRSAVLTVAVIAVSLPPFLVTSCWLHLLGFTGVWREWLPFDIYSLGGTVWILALLSWPITLFLVLADWRRLEAGQLEADLTLRGWPMIRWILLPLSRTGLLQAIVVTFVLTINNFAVPAILQTKVFPAEVWVSFSTAFDYGKALALCWPLLIAPIVLLALLYRRTIEWPALESQISPALLRKQLGNGWFFLCGLLGMIVGLLSTGLPLWQLFATSRTWLELGSAFEAGKSAAWNSLSLAGLGATGCVLIGLISWRRSAGNFLWLPFLAPGLLVGLSLSFLFNRPFASMFYQSIGIVLVGLVLHYAALSWKTAGQLMESVDSDLAAAARLQGASRWQTLRYVHWPQIAPKIGALWYVTYVLCLWDVETMILVIPPGAETLAMRVFNLLHYGHNTQVNALCLLLLGLAVLPLVAWQIGRALRGSFSRIALLLLPFFLASGCEQHFENEMPIDSKFFSKVQIIGTHGTAPNQFNKPRSLALDAADNLYVVDMTGRVQKFSPEGTYLSSWQMPQTDKGNPKGMCRDSFGNIIVVEPHYSRVNHFTTEGKLVAQWGPKGTNAGQLIFPRSVAVNSHGDIYVSEYGVVERVQKFSALGKQFLKAYGVAGEKPGDFNRPEGLGIDRKDQLYVADSCNHRIQIFSDDGKYLRSYGKAGTGPGELSYPYDVQIDPQGRQYVCEFGNSRVQIFDDQGRSLEIIGKMGSAPGQFSNPWSLALDSHGNLYVADSRNHRVQKFIRKANVQTSAKSGGNGKGAS